MWAVLHKKEEIIMPVLRVKNQDGTWSEIPTIVGPQGPQGDIGPQGPQGPKGEDGTGVNILGSYGTEEELNAAQPAGNIGESYLVNGYLYVWSATANKWENVGNIQGPQGPRGEQGPQGEKGETGPQGPQGEQGGKGETGATGAAGYTPVRGTDYWTDADKAEIQAYVDEAILGGAW